MLNKGDGLCIDPPSQLEYKSGHPLNPQWIIDAPPLVADALPFKWQTQQQSLGPESDYMHMGTAAADGTNDGPVYCLMEQIHPTLSSDPYPSHFPILEMNSQIIGCTRNIGTQAPIMNLNNCANILNVGDWGIENFLKKDVTIYPFHNWFIEPFLQVHEFYPKLIEMVLMLMYKPYIFIISRIQQLFKESPIFLEVLNKLMTTLLEKETELKNIMSGILASQPDFSVINPNTIGTWDITPSNFNKFIGIFMQNTYTFMNIVLRGEIQQIAEFKLQSFRDKDTLGARQRLMKNLKMIKSFYRDGIYPKFASIRFDYIMQQQNSIIQYKGLYTYAITDLDSLLNHYIALHILYNKGKTGGGLHNPYSSFSAPQKPVILVVCHGNAFEENVRFTAAANDTVKIAKANASGEVQVPLGGDSSIYDRSQLESDSFFSRQEPHISRLGQWETATDDMILSMKDCFFHLCYENEEQDALDDRSDMLIQVGGIPLAEDKFDNEDMLTADKQKYNNKYYKQSIEIQKSLGLLVDKSSAAADSTVAVEGQIQFTSNPPIRKISPLLLSFNTSIGSVHPGHGYDMDCLLSWFYPSLKTKLVARVGTVPGINLNLNLSSCRVKRKLKNIRFKNNTGGITIRGAILDDVTGNIERQGNPGSAPLPPMVQTPSELEMEPEMEPGGATDSNVRDQKLHSKLKQIKDTCLNNLGIKIKYENAFKGDNDLDQYRAPAVPIPVPIPITLKIDFEIYFTKIVMKMERNAPDRYLIKPIFDYYANMKIKRDNLLWAGYNFMDIFKIYEVIYNELGQGFTDKNKQPISTFEQTIFYHRSIEIIKNSFNINKEVDMYELARTYEMTKLNMYQISPPDTLHVATDCASCGIQC